MKKLNHIVFSVILILLLYGCQTLFFTDEVAWAREQFYSQLDEHYDVVYMGNSHSFTSISPRVVDDILGINSYSLGISEQLIDQTYYELQQLIKFQQPEIIVLEANAIIPSVKSQEIPSDYVSSSNIENYLAAIVDRNVELIDNHSGWKLPSELFNNLNDFLHIISAGKITGEDESGFHPLVNIGNDEEFFVKPDKKGIEVESINEINEYYLNKFSEFCDDNDIKLIIVKTPLMYVSEYQLTFLEDSGLNLDYYDLNLSAISFNQLHFQDPGHLSTFGSLITSIRMAEILAAEMNIKIDNAAYEYFNSYVVSELIIEKIDNSNIQICLNGLEPNENSDLLYKWNVESEDSLNMVTEYQPENCLQVPLIYNVEYRIHIWVNNPEGEFILEGIVTYEIVQED